ncbi:MAG: hypothetical protein FD118_4164, partial [Rhodocyclaceae bacterium]
SSLAFVAATKRRLTALLLAPMPIS